MSLLLKTRRANTLHSVWDLFNDEIFQPIQKAIGPKVPIELQQSNDHVIIKAELPGVDKNKLKIEYYDQNLILTGSKAEVKESPLYNERLSGDFKRVIEVGEIDFEKSKADFDNGILTITLPKAEKSKAKILKIS